MPEENEPAIDLLFNIAEQRLTGVSQDFEGIDFHAVSGGRAGSHHADAINPILANNPFAVGITDRANREWSAHYGPLPLGYYWMEKHPAHHNWVRLTPHKGTYMYGRSGMAIHPRGEIGSHGCIVPDNPAQVMKILDSIRAYLLCHAEKPILKVSAVGDLDRFAPFTQLA